MRIYTHWPSLQTDILPWAGQRQCSLAALGLEFFTPCSQDSAFQTQFLHPCWATKILYSVAQKEGFWKSPTGSTYLFFFFGTDILITPTAPTKIHIQYNKFNYGARCQSEIQKMKLLKAEPQREGSKLEVPAPLSESTVAAAPPTSTRN